MIDKESASKIVNALLAADAEILANEAAIYYKTAAIAKSSGIEAAMRYYYGSHPDNEYIVLVDKGTTATATKDSRAAIQDFLNRIQDVRLRTTGGKRKGPAQRVGRPKKNSC